MTAFIRAGAGKIFNTNTTRNLLGGTGTTELKICFRKISGKSTKLANPAVHKPAPWPYQEKGFTLLNYFFDKTTARFDENSKIIVVDGPIAAGKSKFAKQLAKDLEMLYLPEANLDMIYINEYGYDLKLLDSELPESCRSVDIKDFLLNPRGRLTASFQIQQFIVKYSQYIDALAHLFSTGQGVVLDRCAYSDFVFLEAMYSQGYVSKLARSAYYDVRKNTIGELLQPHLVIYLNVPVNKVQENIQKRNINIEKNSSALTKEYLSVMENNYKQKYLKEISKHAELLVYDWTEEGDVEIVVEDIERIDFDRFDKHDPKMKDWVHYLEEDWAVLRHKYSDQKDSLISLASIPRFDVPELVTEAEDNQKFKDIWLEAPGNNYAKGYDTKMGDTGLLFKTGLNHRYTLPARERRFPN